MLQKVVIIIIAMVVVGLVIVAYQKKKYFYIGTFIYNKNGNNFVFNISQTGHYLLNKTMIPESPKDKAFFKIEEGTYLKKTTFLQIKPEKQVCYFYKDVRALVKNNYYKHESSKPEKYKLSLQNHGLFVNNQRLKRVRKGKLISVKQFANFKNKN